MHLYLGRVPIEDKLVYFILNLHRIGPQVNELA